MRLAHYFLMLFFVCSSTFAQTDSLSYTEFLNKVINEHPVVRQATLVRNIGDVQSNVALIAIGIMVNPVMKNIVAPHSHNALKRTHFEKITLEITGFPLILITNEKITIAITPLINSI